MCVCVCVCVCECLNLAPILAEHTSPYPYSDCPYRYSDYPCPYSDYPYPYSDYLYPRAEALRVNESARHERLLRQGLGGAFGLGTLRKALAVPFVSTRSTLREYSHYPA